jgi:hypothetical protein
MMRLGACVLALLLSSGCGTAMTADINARDIADAAADVEDGGADSASQAEDSAQGDEGSMSADGEGGPAVGAYDTLFVGNSFIYVSDVAGHYRTMVSALSPRPRVEQVTPPGYKLVQHAQDARTDGTPLARWLRTGTPQETSFDAVVLQEQSQVGGFSYWGHERSDSVLAASELSALARARGAAVILYLTWGYEHGDPPNEESHYETYLSMQDQLDHGYLSLAARLREEGSEVRVAPVGGAFRKVYEDVVHSGADPLAEGSEFVALYDADGKHQSLRGAYLAACVVAGAVTRADVRSFVDEPALGREVSARLREYCARTLAEPRWAVPVVRRPDAMIAENPVPQRYLGSAVAMSGDGRRMLVGAPSTGAFGDTAAAARLFVHTGSDWMEEATWRGAAGFGSAVSLNADGSRAFAGFPLRVFGRSGATWIEGATLLEAPPGPVYTFPKVAVNALGTRAIVVATTGPAAMAARVFVESGPGWTEETLAATDPPADAFGPSAALDGEGDRAIVAAHGSSIARVFVRTGTGWVEEGILAFPVMKSGESFVALSADGQRALVVVPAAEQAISFVRSGAIWNVESSVHVLRLVGIDKIVAVALSSDGHRALIGIPGDDPAANNIGGSGSVHIFSLDGAGFRPEFQLVPNDPLGGSRFGIAAAMSADSKRLVVGAPTHWAGDLANGGAAYTFTLP